MQKISLKHNQLQHNIVYSLTIAKLEHEYDFEHTKKIHCNYIAPSDELYIVLRVFEVGTEQISHCACT